jgi:hypothetical protein
MLRIRWMSGLLPLAFVLVASLGCGESGPSLTPVTGKVTVDGQPAEGVTLLFHGANSVSSANSDASGGYSVITDSNPGMPTGSFKVTASWPEKVEASVGMGETPDAPDRLKSKYLIRDQSKITVEVTDSTTELPLVELSTQ